MGKGTFRIEKSKLLQLDFVSMLTIAQKHKLPKKKKKKRHVIFIDELPDSLCHVFSLLVFRFILFDSLFLKNSNFVCF